VPCACSADAATVMKLLEYAALGKTRRMRKLLDRAGKHFAVDAYDAEGWTAVHHACRHGHVEAAQLMLRCCSLMFFYCPLYYCGLQVSTISRSHFMPAWEMAATQPRRLLAIWITKCSVAPAAR